MTHEVYTVIPQCTNRSHKLTFEKLHFWKQVWAAVEWAKATECFSLTRFLRNITDNEEEEKRLGR